MPSSMTSEASVASRSQKLRSRSDDPVALTAHPPELPVRCGPRGNTGRRGCQPDRRISLTLRSRSVTASGTCLGAPAGQPESAPIRAHRVGCPGPTGPRHSDHGCTCWRVLWKAATRQPAASWPASRATRSARCSRRPRAGPSTCSSRPSSATASEPEPSGSRPQPGCQRPRPCPAARTSGAPTGVAGLLEQGIQHLITDQIPHPLAPPAP